MCECESVELVLLKPVAHECVLLFEIGVCGWLVMVSFPGVFEGFQPLLLGSGVVNYDGFNRFLKPVFVTG